LFDHWSLQSFHQVFSLTRQDYQITYIQRNLTKVLNYMK
jgi:hypothetical protein